MGTFAYGSSWVFLYEISRGLVEEFLEKKPGQYPEKHLISGIFQEFLSNFLMQILDEFLKKKI